MDTPARPHQPSRWRDRVARISTHRGQRRLTYGSAQAIPVARLQRREPAYALSLRGYRNFLLSAATQSHTGAGLFGDCRGRRCFTFDIADVLVVAMVRRIGRSLRSPTAADCWPDHCRVWIFPVLDSIR